MIKTIVALMAVCVVSASAALTTRWHHLSTEYDFEAYLAEYGKAYDDAEEYAVREARFLFNRDAAMAHNADPTKSWKEGVNHMSDWTEKEFKATLGYIRMDRPSVSNDFVSSGIPAKALPTEFDWRNASNCVSAVKNQGGCGSCWAFAATETLESHACLKNGLLFSLSPQQIASCTLNPKHCGGTGGCAGGTAEVAYATLAEAGNGLSTLASEWVYPYTSIKGENSACDTTAKGNVGVVSTVHLPANQVDPLLEAIATVGPIAISVDASSWSRYESGVYAGCDMSKPDIDHAVVAIGYGVDSQSGRFLTIRNSWTPTWGEAGYIRVSLPSGTPQCGVDTTPQDGYGCDGGPANVTVCGMCGMLSDSCYPVPK